MYKVYSILERLKSISKLKNRFFWSCKSFWWYNNRIFRSSQSIWCNHVLSFLTSHPLLQSEHEILTAKQPTDGHGEVTLPKKQMLKYGTYFQRQQLLYFVRLSCGTWCDATWRRSSARPKTRASRRTTLMRSRTISPPSGAEIKGPSALFFLPLLHFVVRG